MSNVALPTVTIGDPIGVIEAAGFTVYDGRAPQGASAPFVSVAALPPVNLARGLATEDWGRLFGRYQISCFGVSVAQAEWLRGQVLSLAWGRAWDMSDTLEVFEDTTDQPPQWNAAFTLTEGETVEETEPGVTTWNDAGDSTLWNDAGDSTLWS